MKKGSKLLIAFFAVAMVLCMFSMFVSAETIPEAGAKEGYIRIKLNIYDWNTGAKLPNVEMGINRRGSTGEADVTNLITLTSNADGVAYVEVPYTVSGNCAYINGVKIHDTKNATTIYFDMDALDSDTYNKVDYSYKWNATEARRIRNCTIVANAAPMYTSGSSRIQFATNADESTKPLYDNFWFHSYIVNDNSGAWVEFDVYLEVQNHTVSFKCDETEIMNFAKFSNGQTVKAGKTATKPTDIPVYGFDSTVEFAYWALQGDNTPYDFSTPVTSCITLVPVWVQNFTVSFETEDLTNASEFTPQTVKTLETATEPSATPEKTGKEFKYWSLDGITEYDFSSPVYNSITLQPVWKRSGVINFKIYMWDHANYVSKGSSATYADGQTQIPISGVRMILKSYESNLKGLVADSQKISVGRADSGVFDGVTVTYNGDGTFTGSYVITDAEMEYLEIGNVIDCDPDTTVFGTYNRAVTVPADKYATAVSGIGSHAVTENIGNGTEESTFDWDWYVQEEDNAGAGLTGLRVIPEGRNGTYTLSDNPNDVIVITDDMKANGFEYTIVCYVVPSVEVRFDSAEGTPNTADKEEYDTQKFKPVNSVPASQQDFRATDPTTISGNSTPTAPDGMQFVGWYEVLLDKDGKETGLASSPWDFENRVVTYSVTLRAVYADKTYNVKWMNGDTLVEEETVKNGDVPYFDAAVPTQPDSDDCKHVFAGWTIGDSNTVLRTIIYNKDNNTWRTGFKVEAADQVYKAVFTDVPIFRVVHSSDGTVDVLYVSDYSSGFNITKMVKSGYLYGGLYTSKDFTSPYTDKEKFQAVYGTDTEFNGLNITPIAGATYYLKEVSNEYLKIMNFIDYDTRKDGNLYLQAIYGVTALDSTNYLSYGFLFLEGYPEKFESFLSGTNYNKEQVYNSARCDGGVANVVSFGLSTGYVGVNLIFGSPSDYYKLDEFGGTYSYIPYWVTYDGIQVFNGEYRVFRPEEAYLFYTKSGKYSGYKPETGHITDNEDKELTNICIKYDEGMSLTALPLATSYRFTPETGILPEIVKYDNDSVSVQCADFTDMTDYVTYVGDDSKVFVGWYTDPEFTCPADFSEVGDDMEVYAKYVPKSSIRVSLASTKTGVNVVLSMEDYGFTSVSVNVNGTVNTVTENDDIIRLNSIISTLLGKQTDVAYTASLNGVKIGKNLITVCWTTADGSEISDYTLECINSFGMLRFN